MKKAIAVVLLAIVAIMLLALPVLAYTYRAQVAISENVSTSYAMLPTMWDSNNAWMADNGFMKSTALDTRIQTLGGLNKPHMVSENRTLTAIPVPADSQTNLYFVTGESDLSAMDIIVGHSSSDSTGYISVTDEASIELGDNFTAETLGWVDTSAPTSYLYFDGAGDWVETGNTTDFKWLHGADDVADFKWTIEFWMKLDDPNPNGIYSLLSTGEGDSTKVGTDINYNDSGGNARRLQVIIYKGGGDYVVNGLSDNVSYPNDTNWHHIHITYDQTLANTNCKLYIDNVAEGTLNKTGDAPSTANSENELHIGIVGNETAQDLLGSLDAMRISDVVRSAGDRASAYATDRREGLTVDDDTVALWLLDECVGVDAFDETSNNHDGTVTNALWIPDSALILKELAFSTFVSGTENITSRVGTNLASVTATGVSSDEHKVRTTEGYYAALSFDGTDDRIIVPHHASLNFSGDITLESWVQWDLGDSQIIGKGNFVGWQIMWYFYILANGTVAFNAGNAAGGGSAFGVTTTDTVTPGEWTHIVCIVDGATAYIYLDGAESKSGAAAARWSDSSTVRIGERVTGIHDATANISETRIYSRALTSTEVEEHYRGDFDDESNLVALWLIDEGTAGTIYDTSVNSNDGAITGASWITDAQLRLQIYIDDVLEGRNMVGASVPDNASDWAFIQNNVMPYADNITIWIDGTKELWFEPIDMIVDIDILTATLPDRATSVANDGTIHWGANPSGVGVDVGSMSSSGQPGVGVTAETPARDLLPPVETSDWYVEPAVGSTLLTNPMRPFVTMLSDTTDLTELQAWRLLGLVFVLLVAGMTMRAVPKHLFLTCISAGIAIVALVVMTVWPLYALVLLILCAFGGWVSERSHSL